MTQLDYLEKLRAEFDQCVQLSARKNADYADTSDAFANFRLIETLTRGNTGVAAGIIVRLSDKMQRIANLTRRDNAVADEKITDTLRDLAIYSIILKIFLEEKK